MPLLIAVLDDDQEVAARAADWDALGADVEVAFFSDHVAEDETLGRRLEPFDVVVAMPSARRSPPPGSIACPDCGCS